MKNSVFVKTLTQHKKHIKALLLYVTVVISCGFFQFEKNTIQRTLSSQTDSRTHTSSVSREEFRKRSLHEIATPILDEVLDVFKIYRGNIYNYAKTHWKDHESIPRESEERKQREQKELSEALAQQHNNNHREIIKSFAMQGNRFAKERFFEEAFQPLLKALENIELDHLEQYPPIQRPFIRAESMSLTIRAFDDYFIKNRKKIDDELNVNLREARTYRYFIPLDIFDRITKSIQSQLNEFITLIANGVSDQFDKTYQLYLDLEYGKGLMRKKQIERLENEALLLEANGTDLEKEKPELAQSLVELNTTQSEIEQNFQNRTKSIIESLGIRGGIEKVLSYFTRGTLVGSGISWFYDNALLNNKVSFINGLASHETGLKYVDYVSSEYSLQFSYLTIDRMKRKNRRLASEDIQSLSTETEQSIAHNNHIGPIHYYITRVLHKILNMKLSLKGSALKLTDQINNEIKLSQLYFRTVDELDEIRNKTLFLGKFKLDDLALFQFIHHYPDYYYGNELMKDTYIALFEWMAVADEQTRGKLDFVYGVMNARLRSMASTDVHQQLQNYFRSFLLDSSGKVIKETRETCQRYKDVLRKNCLLSAHARESVISLGYSQPSSEVRETFGLDYNSNSVDNFTLGRYECSYAKDELGPYIYFGNYRPPTDKESDHGEIKANTIGEYFGAPINPHALYSADEIRNKNDDIRLLLSTRITTDHLKEKRKRELAEYYTDKSKLPDLDDLPYEVEKAIDLQNDYVKRFGNFLATERFLSTIVYGNIYWVNDNAYKDLISSISIASGQMTDRQKREVEGYIELSNNIVKTLRYPDGIGQFSGLTIGQMKQKELLSASIAAVELGALHEVIGPPNTNPEDGKANPRYAELQTAHPALFAKNSQHQYFYQVLYKEFKAHAPYTDWYQKENWKKESDRDENYWVSIYAEPWNTQSPPAIHPYFPSVTGLNVYFNNKHTIAREHFKIKIDEKGITEALQATLINGESLLSQLETLYIKANHTYILAQAKNITDFTYLLKKRRYQEIDDKRVTVEEMRKNPLNITRYFSIPENHEDLEHECSLRSIKTSSNWVELVAYIGLAIVIGVVTAGGGIPVALGVALTAGLTAHSQLPAIFNAVNQADRMETAHEQYQTVTSDQASEARAHIDSTIRNAALWTGADIVVTAITFGAAKSLVQKAAMKRAAMKLASGQPLYGKELARASLYFQKHGKSLIASEDFKSIVQLIEHKGQTVMRFNPSAWARLSMEQRKLFHELIKDSIRSADGSPGIQKLLSEVALSIEQQAERLPVVQKAYQIIHKFPSLASMSPAARDTFIRVYVEGDTALKALLFNHKKTFAEIFTHIDAEEGLIREITEYLRISTPEMRRALLRSFHETLNACNAA